ncbi:MAG: hypothetical protein HDS83_02450 [Bacteroidales bacterium]|nr:hypothetical protein [Bacteroidales bacterium]
MKVSDSVYKVNIKKLAILTLPTWLRKPLLSALIYAGVSPLSRLVHDLRKFRTSTNYRLQHNGQVCKLRGALNDEFDPEERRIYIEDHDSTSRVELSTIYLRSEKKWVMVPQRETGSVIINSRGFAGTSGIDFWIYAPSELSNVRTRMKAFVNSYKLASKRFTIFN